MTNWYGQFKRERYQISFKRKKKYKNREKTGHNKVPMSMWAMRPHGIGTDRYLTPKDKKARIN